MEHLRLHADVLPPNRAVYDGGSGFNRNAARGPRSDRAVDYGQNRPVLVNVFHYLSNEFVAVKWEANMHNVALGHRCGQIDVYAKGLMLALNNLHQCLAYLSEADDDYSLFHGLCLTTDNRLLTTDFVIRHCRLLPWRAVILMKAAASVLRTRSSDF